jgi:glutamyl-tRNA reductase
MSVLVVGLSYRSAPVSVLERASVSTDDLPKLLDELHTAPAISEVLLLSTCNRIEIYADVARFHPALADISGVLARHAGLTVPDLGEHLYVHFAEAAVGHLFSVAAGLDSMIVGESQILGQLRSSYAAAVQAASVGSMLHDLAQNALRVGKRAHTETGIDQAGASVMSVAVAEAKEILGPLDRRRAMIVGAGSMGALAAATLRRAGILDLAVANRSPERARRLANSVGGRAIDLDDAAAEIAAADLLVSATGATGVVLPSSLFGPRTDQPLVILDVALPHDVDPAVASIPGVTYIELDSLRKDGAVVSDNEVRAATAIVDAELAGYLQTQQQLAVAPTVTALRSRANQVIDGELLRLDGRLPTLDPATRGEVADAVRRAVEKVLHAPTVRVKELASTPDGGKYAAALRELFDLDPAAAESVATVRMNRDLPQ